MSMPVIKLQRNLRKSLLQGHPWVYREALREPPDSPRAGLCLIKDSQGDFIGWGLYSPEGPLSVRMLSLEKKAPTSDFFQARLRRALQLRQSLIQQGHTTCYRLVNGEGDLLPGMICDVYHRTAVMQFDGLGPHQFWDSEWLAQWLLHHTEVERVYLKPRHDLIKTKGIEPQCWGKPLDQPQVAVKENNCHFMVDIVSGQKTGFFLDQRDNRHYLQFLARGKRVLNLFSYSGGFSIYAGRGEARHVTSVDISAGALALAQHNWKLNSLPPEDHRIEVADVFEYIEQTSEQFELIICDPPSLAKSEKQKAQAQQTYTQLFAQAARRVAPGGDLILSSCSSHIDFQDFEQIVSEALSKARRRGQVLRVSGQGFDHPYPHCLPQMRYLKFYHLVL